MHARPRVAQTILVLVSLWAYFATPTFAQLYRTDQVDEKAKNRFLIQQCVGDPAKYAAEQQKFNEFFKNYFFPAMTRTDPTALGELSGFREELFKNCLWKTTNQQLQKDVTEMAYGALGAFVVSKTDPPYHPTVRYNAVLMLGLLDSQYANPALVGTAAAVAKPRATNELATIVDSATTSKNYPPLVILGALIGLERHAQLRQSLSAESIDKMTTAALKIVTRDKPLPEMDEEVYAWMRLRAASVLAQLGSVGKDNQVFNALVQLVGSLSSIDDRCEAAALLAKLNYEGAKVDGAVTAEQLLKLTSAVSEAELAKAVEFDARTFSSSMPVSRSRGGSGSRSAARDTSSMDAKDLYPRRPLVAHLLSLQQAMTKTKPLVPSDAQAKFTDVLAAIDPVIKKATDKDTIEPDVADAVRTMAGIIARIAAATAPAPAAPLDAAKTAPADTAKGSPPDSAKAAPADKAK